MRVGSVRVLFALPVVGHPRDSKRMAMLQQEKFEVEAVAFRRKYHPGRLPTCPVTVVAEIEHGHYLRRALQMLCAIPAFRRAIKEHDIVYASGPDMALLCLLAGVGCGRPVALEIGDIREVQTSAGVKGWMVRRIDRAIADLCCLLVATAPDFVDVYYRQWVGSSTQALIVENKLDADSRTRESALAADETRGIRPGIDRPIRIGYFGILRSTNSWEMLRALAERRPREFEIVIAGQVVEPADLTEQVSLYDNMTYLGEYRSPDDLPQMFSRVDLILGMYPEDRDGDWNQRGRWARTNRFYESCYFQKPIITRKGSKDASEVERLGIGLTIDNGDPITFVRSVSQITYDQIREWNANLARVPPETYLYTREAATLGQALRSFLRESP